MDFFKFESSAEPTTLDQGEHINDIDKAMWVERYNAPGEFSFTGKLSSGLKDFLPIGTLISHADTFDIMVAENQEIHEKEDEDSTIEISGRSFLSLLENRIIGTNYARMSSTVIPYVVEGDFSWNQVVYIINDHIGNTTNTDDNLAQVVSTAPGFVYTDEIIEERNIDFGTVLEKIMEVLKVDDLGVKTIRKNTFGVGSSAHTTFLVHRGVDRSSTVFFSWQGGDVSSMNYLFSNKNLKNSAMVKGQYVWVIVDIGPIKYDRRMMLVDGSDIDGHLDAFPDGFTLPGIVTAMNVLGRQALRGQNQITINQSDISRTSLYQYRRDYDIGDLVGIGGNFGEIELMRVIEYAEIEDENGESGHPTFGVLGV